MVLFLIYHEKINEIEYFIVINNSISLLRDDEMDCIIIKVRDGRWIDKDGSFSGTQGREGEVFLLKNQNMKKALSFSILTLFLCITLREHQSYFVSELACFTFY